MRVLFATTELFPLVKAGGLGDVSAALPKALCDLGADVRILMPGYPAVLDGLTGLRTVARFPGLMGRGDARLRLGRAHSGVPVYALDAPFLFEGPEGPYAEAEDSHIRFGALSWAAALVASRGAGRWRPDLLHANDWHTALAPAYLSLWGGPRPATVQAIHNLAYTGLFPARTLPELGLSREAFHPEGVEFFGQVGFLKAGLRYADRLCTVSPTYAKEIQDPRSGYGLDGLLAARSSVLTGILNGIDMDVWDPARSPHLAATFDARRLARRGANKAALQAELGLAQDAEAPVLGVVSRLVALKGLDLLLPNLEWILSQGAQLAVLGQGEPGLEDALRAASLAHPGRIAVRVGFDEGLAHRMMAGSDLALVPSRSEPCGLTQLYALRYGALPLVRRTGGLADSVVDATRQSLAEQRATGFMFDEADPFPLGQAIGTALRLYRDEPKVWRAMQKRGMGLDLGWDRAAEEYLQLYRDLLPGRA